MFPTGDEGLRGGPEPSEGREEGSLSGEDLLHARGNPFWALCLDYPGIGRKEEGLSTVSSERVLSSRRHLAGCFQATRKEDAAPGPEGARDRECGI